MKDVVADLIAALTAISLVALYGWWSDKNFPISSLIVWFAILSALFFMKRLLRKQIDVRKS